MDNSEQLYEVEIKSQALLREGQRGFITYFRGGPEEAIVRNVQKLYPQFTKPKDKPNVLITPISEKEYSERKKGRKIKQKGQILQARGHIL